MRRIVLLSLLTLGIASMPANANDYVFRDGFYWLNGNAFTRTLVSVPGTPYYDYCGRYCLSASRSYYTYTQVPVAVKKQATPVQYGDNWKSEIAKAAAAKEDHAAFQKALTTVFPQQVSAQTVQSDSTYLGGSTAYGYLPYTYQTVKQAYGELDLNQLYQAAARLAQSSQQYSSEATSNHAGLVQSAGDQAARVAEINAKRDAVVAMAKSIEPQASSTTTTTVQGYAKAESSSSSTVGPVMDRLSLALNNNCLECHAGNKAKGNLDLTNWKALTEVQKNEIHRRILLPKTDPKHMPQGKDLAHEDLVQILIH